MNQDELNQLLTQIAQLTSDVHDIKRALVGSKEYSEPGLIRDVNDLKKWRQAINLRVAFWTGAAATVVFIANHVFDYLVSK